MITVGNTVRVQVTFRDWDQPDDVGALTDPDAVTVDVVDLDTDQSTVQAEQAVRVDVGTYYYDWTPQQVGKFRVIFAGDTVGADPVEVYEDFIVTETGTVDSTVTGFLGQDVEVHFATSAEPLLVDPEEFVGTYEDAGLVEIMGIVHRFSVEVERVFTGKEIPFAAYEYIRAAVLCALSRTYDVGVGGSSGQESSITLGDFAVTTRGSTSFTRSTRANAGTWCELAAALRQEMMYARNSAKTYVRGSKYPNPMPQRHVRSMERGFRGR